jgi:hypothetical protein
VNEDQCKGDLNEISLSCDVYNNECKTKCSNLSKADCDLRTNDCFWLLKNESVNNDILKLESGRCVIDPCVSSIVDKDGHCNSPCVLDGSDGSVCVVDPCINYDEVSCVNNYLIFCSINTSLNSCHTHRCTDLDLRSFFFTFFIYLFFFFVCFFSLISIELFLFIVNVQISSGAWLEITNANINAQKREMINV